MDLFWPPSMPRTRGDCRDGPRPCPWVRCRYHLALDVKEESGAITLNFPSKELSQLKETCALDVAERGGVEPSTIGALMNVSAERVRQIQVGGLERMLERLKEEC